MMKMAMSPAAAGLIRALFARSGIAREAVLLTDYRSTEWHSLTFAGERHEIGFRVPGPEAADTVAKPLDGIDEAEFSISGQIVADIAVEHPPSENADGSISLGIEALTIAS
ncbi:MAG: hypothetical protein ABR588_08995 [Sphingomicrobium sp.]|nr:hypothetical protein [Sphingomonadales bacterium]